MVPRRVDGVAERTVQVGVNGNHGLVVERGSPRLTGKKGNLIRWPGHASVRRLRHSHLRAVDGSARAKEHDNVAVIDIAPRVPGNAGIGAEVEAIVRPRWRKRRVNAAPGFAAVAGEERTHGQPLDLIRPGDDLARVGRVDRDRRLALRAGLIAGVYVLAYRDAICPAPIPSRRA